MAIDPRIILQGGQPTQFDPMGAMQQGLTMRHLLDTRARQKQQWALEDQQRQQAAAQESAVRGVWQQSGGDPGKVLEGLQRAGLHEQYLGAAKAFDDRRKASATAGKDEGEGRLKQQEYLRNFAVRLGGMANNPEMLTNYLAQSIQRGEINEAQGVAIADQLSATPQAQWGRQMMGMIASPDEWLRLQTPKMETINDGQQTHLVDTNAFTNPNQAPIQMQASPEAMLTDARGQQSNRIAAGQLAVAQGNLAQRRAQDAIQTQLAQGNLSVAQQRLALDQQAPRGTPMVTADGQSGLIDPRTGVFRPAVDQNGQPIQQGKVAEERITKVRQAQEALQVADQIEGVLPNATGSHLGNIRDQAAAAFGQSTQGAQAIAQLRVLGTKLIQQVPRFEGPQSNQDVQLYKEAAGDLANPTTPIATKQAALQTIRSLNQQYLAQQGQQPQGAPERPAQQPQQGLGAGQVSGQVRQSGASGSWGDAPVQRQQVQTMPMPNSVPAGAVITDNRTGQRFRNDGRNWVPVQ